MDLERVEIRAWEPGDEAELLPAFNEVFARDDPRFEPRSPEAWRWAFRDNPAGTRVFLALVGGRVVAQYAALPARALLRGRPATFCQIVDSFVRPEQRGGRLFVRTAEAFFERFGGADRDAVHYGWPVERAWRVGKRFLGYTLVRPQVFLARDLAGAPSGPDPDGVEEAVPLDEQILWLYERCAGEWGASAVRDAETLAWRYARRPGGRYATLGVRDGEGVLRGLAVLAPRSALAPGVAVVCDWLVPAGEPEIGERLAAAAARWAARSGAGALAALFPEWSPWFDRFQTLGFALRPSPQLTVARSFDPRAPVDLLRESWWYQPGDFDLV